MSQSPPSVEEVVLRLDKLWSEKPDAPPLLDFSGQRVGAYRLEEPVGCGAFGVVYRARDEAFDRDVALKIPRPEVLLDADKLGRFESEAATAAALDHPSIIPVYTADLSGPTPFIATAYCPGPDLGEWLAKRSSPVVPERAARFMIQIAEAVDYAHRQGVLHRDLKPGNILMEPRQGADEHTLDGFQPKLTDFGLAKLVESTLQHTRSSMLVGTPLYMAPEQLVPNGREASKAADVYALGVLLFELLTFRTPFEGENYIEVVDRLRHEEPPRLQSVRPEAPRELQAICGKCLEKDPQDRYASARELADELRRFVAGQPIETRPATRLDCWRRWLRRPERITAAGRFTLTLQLVLIVWVLANLSTVLLFDLVPEAVLRRSARDFLFVTFVIHLPKAGLGWRLMRGSRWAYWPSAISSALLLAVFIHGATSRAVAFDYNYPTPLSKVQVFSILILCCAADVVLHALAVPAWFRNRRGAA